MGAAGEHLVAAYYLSQGTPVFFPVAQAGWVDLVVQTAHGFNRVQVKTQAVHRGHVRVRDLGLTPELDPEDRYDTLAVVHTHKLWLIPAAALSGRQSLTLNPQDVDCPWNGYRKR